MPIPLKNVYEQVVILKKTDIYLLKSIPKIIISFFIEELVYFLVATDDDIIALKLLSLYLSEYE